MENLPVFYLNRETRFGLARTEAATEEVPEKAESNPFAPEEMAGYTVTAILTIINLLIAYLILKRFVFKPIIRVMEKRREAVEAELREAADKSVQSEERLAEADKALQQARIEAADIISEAREQANRQSEMIMSTAKEAAEAARRKAEDDAERIHRTSVDLMKEEVADLAVAIAQKVIGVEISDSKKEEVRLSLNADSRKAEVRRD